MSPRRPTPNTTLVSGRVSPTAPDSRSASTNVWRLAEADPRFREGMARAAEDFENGRTVPLSEVIRDRRRS